MFYINIKRKNDEIINMEQILSVAKKDSDIGSSLIFTTCSGFVFTRVFETMEERDACYELICDRISNHQYQGLDYVLHPYHEL